MCPKENIYNPGCPKHGKTYLSLFFNDLEDKLYERCTIQDCDFQKEHKNRRVNRMPVDKDRRKNTI